MSRSSTDTSLFFFFFQAEDGIRDLTVTGVQTCALPISTDVAERDWNLAERLDGVGMEQHAGVATSTRERAHRLQRADLVIGPHHAHDGDAVLENPVERLLLDLAGGRHGENDLVTTEVLHGVRGGERRLVLRGGNGDAERAATISRCKRGTDDGEVEIGRAHV